MGRVRRITQIVVWHDFMVDAMVVSYELEAAEEQSQQWGSPRDANRSEVYPSHISWLVQKLLR
jgi:hypothetical protein